MENTLTKANDFIGETSLYEIFNFIDNNGSGEHPFNHLDQYSEANFRSLALFLRRYACHIPSNVLSRQFPLFLGDGNNQLEDSMAFSPPQNKNNLPIVDPIMIRSEFYVQGLQEINSNTFSHKERINKAYWRGALTGTPSGNPQENQMDFERYFSFIGGEKTQLQRVRLCRLARSFPEFLDCKITSTSQWLYSETIHARLNDELLISDQEPFERNMFHKYVIDIDGHSNSWPGFFMKLGSGSCVLKVMSPFLFCQWYYKYLSPWKHYVPVMEDMSDLIEKIRYLELHDEIAEEISHRASNFILSKTSEEWAKICVDDLVIGMKMLF